MPKNDAKRTCQWLSEKERLDVISKLSKPAPPSKCSLAREYGVTEGAVRKVWKQKDEIQQRSMSMSVETRSQTFHHSKGQDNSNLENDDDDETISAQNNKNSEQVLFSGFDTHYENMVALEDQILCKEFQDEAGEKYEKITSHILALQQLLQGVTRDVKQR